MNKNKSHLILIENLLPPSDDNTLIVIINNSGASESHVKLQENQTTQLAQKIKGVRIDHPPTKTQSVQQR